MHHGNINGSETTALATRNVFQLYQFLVPGIFAVIVLLGLIGNILVIYVILTRPKLRTVTNLLLLNLAVADVSFLLLCGSFSTVHYALAEWPFGDTFCRVIQYLNYVTCYVTVYTLVAVSVVRFVTVVYGPQCRLIRDQKNIFIITLVIWISFLVAKIPILLVHGVSKNVDTNRTECMIEGRREGQELFASFFVFAYALPLGVIATLYIALVCHLKRQQNELVEHSCNGTVVNRHAETTPLNSHVTLSPQRNSHATRADDRGRHVTKADDRNRHVTKIVLLVVAVFAVCWLPLHIHILLGYYYHASYTILLIIWHSLAFLNSVLDPIIYTCFSRDFRDSFRELCGCNPDENARPCCRISQPEAIQPENV